MLVLTVGCGKMNSVSIGAGFGINLAGAEFGALEPDFSNANLGNSGQNYFFPASKDIAYYADKGLRLIRLPVSWERLQPQLGSELDSTYVSRILECLDRAAQLDCYVVLDLHNYGRYRYQNGPQVRELIVAAQATNETEIDNSSLINLWLRLSERIRHHPAITAYGLMNEPHDMAGADWHTTSNEIVLALRNAGDQNWIWVAGDGWASAEKWAHYNPATPWITDSLNRIAYEAHVYFDSDSSGKYVRSFAQEQQLDSLAGQRGYQRIQPFANWCESHNVVGVIGEFGIPWNDPGWLPVLEQFLSETRRRNIKACAWAGGQYWGDYNLSMQPRGGYDVAPLTLTAWHNSQADQPVEAQPSADNPIPR
jgi:endoglucanase